MAGSERCCVYVGLLVLLALLGSLSAIPQTFGPLIRARSKPAQTSEEELNANIDHIYRRDFDTPAQLELVTRSAPVRQRERQPISSEDQNQNVTIVRDKNGKLKAVFATTPAPSVTRHTQYEPVVSHAPTKNDDILVLRAATMDANGTPLGETLMEDNNLAAGSYPPDYPFAKLRRILEKNHEMYSKIFEPERASEVLVTRVDGPTDPYLCSSTRTFQYPTYHREANVNIVNVKGFYQHVTFEVCDNVNASCSNAVAASSGKLYCDQVEGIYEVYTVPVDDSGELVKTKLKFPSCCKCRHA